MVWPLARSTLDGIEESVGPPEMLGEILAPRFTVPEKSSMLEIVMVDVPSIPGLTHRVVGLAEIEKCGFWAAARDVDRTRDVKITIDRPRVLTSLCF
jgi:hypothetical protein